MKLHSIFWFLLFSDQLSHKKYNNQQPPDPTWCLARVSKFCNSRSASGISQDVDLEEWSPLYTSISWSDDGMLISTYPLLGSICKMYIYMHVHIIGMIFGWMSSKMIFTTIPTLNCSALVFGASQILKPPTNRFRHGWGHVILLELFSWTIWTST